MTMTAEFTTPSSDTFEPNAAPTVPPAAVPTSAVPGRENAFAITSFVLGIASIVSSWTFFAPIIGLVFGILALRRRTTERTLALWGVWLNAIMLAGTVIFAGVALLLFAAGTIATLPFWW